MPSPRQPAGPCPSLELALRLLLVGAGPAVLFALDATAAARGLNDGRAEQCAVMWAILVGLWQARLRREDLPLFLWWLVAASGWVMAWDALKAPHQLPPLQALAGLVAALALAGLHSWARRLWGSR